MDVTLAKTSPNGALVDKKLHRIMSFEAAARRGRRRPRGRALVAARFFLARRPRHPPRGDRRPPLDGHRPPTPAAPPPVVSPHFIETVLIPPGTV